MEGRLLEWIKVVGPIIISWPTVAAVAVLIFRKRLLDLISQFTERSESSAEIGPIKIQLGKNVFPPQYHLTTAQNGSEKIDLSVAIGKIRDVGPEGTTVGFCVAYAMQAAIKAKTGEEVVLSPRSIYLAAKKYDEFPGEDHEGTSLTGALEAMEKVGAYLESDWPYSNKIKPEPGKTPAYRISSYQELKEIEQVLHAMRQGKVVIASVTVTKDLYTTDKDGRVVIKLPLNEVVGAKTICLVGYDDENAEFKFANDWGTRWGKDGFGIIRDTDLSRILLNAYRLEL